MGSRTCHSGNHDKFVPLKLHRVKKICALMTQTFDPSEIGSFSQVLEFANNMIERQMLGSVQIYKIFILLGNEDVRIRAERFYRDILRKQYIAWFGNIRKYCDTSGYHDILLCLILAIFGLSWTSQRLQFINLVVWLHV